MELKNNIIAFLLFNCKLYRLRYYQKSRWLKKYYSSNRPRLKNNAPQIIFMCDDHFHNGGLGDRIHGALSLYKYCVDKKLRYKINFCDPFRLHDYLLPNKYDWDIDPDDVCWNSKDVQVVVAPLKTYGRSIEYNSKFIIETIDFFRKLHPKKQLHIYTNAHYTLQPEIYSELFHTLFKMDDNLETTVNENLKKIGKDFHAMVFRFQNLLGDFYEGKYPTLSEENQKVLIERNLQKIDEIHSMYCKDKIILITSDSRKFLDIAEKRYTYIRTIPGQIVHMSYTPMHNYNVNLKPFVDLLTLSYAKKIYLLCTGDMYKSGFAQSASLINMTNYEEIIF